MTETFLHMTSASPQERYKLKTSNTFAFVYKTFLRCPVDVSFADKRLKHVSQTSFKPKLTKDVFVTKMYGSLGSCFKEGGLQESIPSRQRLCMV